MILAVDIGNTQIVVGCLEGEKLISSFRLATDRSRTAEEYTLLLSGIFAMRGISAENIDGGIVSSVVPVLRPVFRDAMERITGKRPLVVGAGVKTGLNIKTDIPSQVGSDRIVDAVAACAKYPLPIMIVDMGTSSTISVIDRKKNFLGGMIIPGLRLAVDALSARASQLPQNISLEPPKKMIGTNTLDCMKSGSVYGSAAMLDGLIARVERELGEAVTVVATGGNISMVAPLCRKKLHVEPDLLLHGLRILYEKNQKK